MNQYQETIDQIGRGAYCWKCHFDEATLFCSACELPFHNIQKCSGTRKLSAQNAAEWQCMECIKIEKDKQELQRKEIDAQCLKGLLKGAVDSLKLNVSESVAKFPKEMAKIDSKLNAGTYLCLEELFLDIKRIAYNVDSVLSQNRAEHKVIVETAKRLVANAGEELHRIRLCHECSHSGAITEVCKQPHLLVWAQAKSYPYWPAKLIAVNTNEVEVIFFGAPYNRGLLSPLECLLYSKSNPSMPLHQNHKLHEKWLDQAQQEALSYIRSIEAKFGSFNYASEHMPLLIEHLDRHLYEMIPNAWPANTTIPLPIPLPFLTQTNQQRKRRASTDASIDFDLIRERCDDAEKKFSLLDDKNRKLAVENAILTGQITRLENKFDRLEKTEKEMAKLNEDLKIKNTRLEKMNEESNEELTNNRARLKEMEDCNVKLTTDLESANHVWENKCASLENKCASLENRCPRLENMCARLEKKCARLENENKNLVDLLKKMQAQIQANIPASFDSNKKDL